MRSATRSRRHAFSGVLALLVLTTVLSAGASASGAPSASAGTSPSTQSTQARAAAAAPARAAGNPLAKRPWGVYKGKAEMAWEPYANATGERKRLLGKIALRPKAKWFGAWIPNRDIATRVREYISNSQAGNRNALVQMSVFRMVPWEHDACKRLPTKAQQASYKQWVNRFASAVGNTRTAIVLQPDGPFALCAPRGSRLPSRLIAYSAKKFSSLPNTSVYIDAGAADWPANGRQGGIKAAVRILIPAGIRYTRGFALNSTHYSSTPNEVRRGTNIVNALRARGIRGKKFVVNTSSNGKPFEFGRYQGPDPDNAWVCRSRTDKRTCVALGIPPTADVSNRKWGLPAKTRRQAGNHVDAYLWFGRPWLYRQNSPFKMDRALTLARVSRW